MTKFSNAAWQQKVATLSRDKTDTILLVVTCTLVLLPFCAVLPGDLIALAGALIVWRSWLTISGRMLPARWLLLAISAVLLGGVYIHFHTWLGRDAGIAFLVILACLKMLELHARRDVLALVFVCYFLLVGQLLYSQSLLAALYLMFCTALLLTTQLNFQYHQLLPSLTQRLLGGFKIMLTALPLALILFLFFPRLEGPLWGKQQGNAGVTGLSDTMEPGNVAELALSDQIAFRVRFSGATPASSLLYWRGIVLDHFDGRRWTSDEPDDSTAEPSPESGSVINQDIIMEPHSRRWLFGLDQPVALVSYNGSAVPTGSHRFGRLTAYGEMRSPNPIQERIRYTLRSVVPDHRPASADSPVTTPSPAQSLAARRQSLQLPAGLNPLTEKWTQQLANQTHDPVALANLVLHFYREQPFRYTLSPPPVGINQVDDFLFGTQAGFCEHYASSFVVIMRYLHIPARVVTGYQGGEPNVIDGLLTVRQSDAHAWAEIWIDQIGWLRVDPTAAVAPSRVERGISAALGKRSGVLQFSPESWLGTTARLLRARWDATNSAWNIWILNYNLDKQKQLLSSLSGIKNPEPAQLGIAMMIAASLVVAAITLFLMGKKTPVSPLDRLYQTFCRHMQRRGYPRQTGEGPLDYGARLLPAFRNSRAISDFLTLYSQCQYGTRYNQSQLVLLTKLLKLCRQLKPDSSAP